MHGFENGDATGVSAHFLVMDTTGRCVGNNRTMEAGLDVGGRFLEFVFFFGNLG